MKTCTFCNWSTADARQIITSVPRPEVGICDMCIVVFVKDLIREGIVSPGEFANPSTIQDKYHTIAIGAPVALLIKHDGEVNL